MKSDRLVIFAVLFLAAGLGLVLGFTNGSTALNVAYPFSETRLHVEIATMGIPVLTGVPLILAGTVLLVFALIAAIASQFRREESFQSLHLPADISARRRPPFAEFEE
jgi:hypothetical protein